MVECRYLSQSEHKGLLHMCPCIHTLTHACTLTQIIFLPLHFLVQTWNCSRRMVMVQAGEWWGMWREIEAKHMTVIKADWSINYLYCSVTLVLLSQVCGEFSKLLVQNSKLVTLVTQQVLHSNHFIVHSSFTTQHWSKICFLWNTIRTLQNTACIAMISFQLIQQQKMQDKY